MFPKTTLERIVFTTTGVIFMATTMSIYNKVLAQGLFTIDTFKQVPMAFLQRAPLAWILQYFFVQNAVGKMSARYPIENRMVYYTIRTGFTVLIMCPIMSIYSNIIYVGVNTELFFLWLPKMVLNWPFAFFVQIFLLGPLNRFLFGLIFRRKVKTSPKT
jgi:hypothetical protein